MGFSALFKFKIQNRASTVDTIHTLQLQDAGSPQHGNAANARQET